MDQEPGHRATAQRPSQFEAWQADVVTFEQCLQRLRSDPTSREAVAKALDAVGRTTRYLTKLVEGEARQ